VIGVPLDDPRDPRPVNQKRSARSASRDRGIRVPWTRRDPRFASRRDIRASWSHSAFQKPICVAKSSAAFWLFVHFVLDSEIFSSIIYILYEGGSLSPPVVTVVIR